jgi:acylphosphatase
MSDRTALLLRIHGRVQGVGYRQSLAGEAQARGLTGWVRNRTDGTVEALLEGGSAKVAEVLEWARHGPPAAKVVRIDQQPGIPGAGSSRQGFETLPTL